MQQAEQQRGVCAFQRLRHLRSGQLRVRPGPPRSLPVDRHRLGAAVGRSAKHPLKVAVIFLSPQRNRASITSTAVGAQRAGEKPRRASWRREDAVAREAGDAVLKAGNLVVDLESYRATVDGSPVDLTYQEFELLTLLLKQTGRVVTYDDLVRARWNAAGGREVRRLTVLVCRLRAKLARSWPYQIRTVRRRGYGLLPAT
ncbi:MAG: hypothetical protein GEU28_09880 [Dehalococcoidia bacterium]|nr:hypothetical protein [Dehalococcoidia bacterium]